MTTELAQTTTTTTALAKGGGTREMRQLAAPVAIISAGYKLLNDRAPRRSKNGEIFMHGYAPALQEMLNAKPIKDLQNVFVSPESRELWIAFPVEPELCVSQMFVKWGASQLEAIGDATQVTVFGKSAVPIRYEAGTPEYKQVIETCAVSTFIRFMLATYENNRPDILIGDGGLYALRTGSHSSTEAILARCREIRAFLQTDKLAGIPVCLLITSRTKIDKTGAKRSGLPIWDLQMRVPGVPASQQTLTAVANFVGQAREVQKQAQALMGINGDAPMLPEPTDLALITKGEVLGSDKFLSRFWGQLGGTDMSDDDKREEFLLETLPTINEDWEGVNSLAEIAPIIRRVEADQLISEAIRKFVRAEVKPPQKQVETTGFDNPFETGAQAQETATVVDGKVTEWGGLVAEPGHEPTLASEKTPKELLSDMDNEDYLKKIGKELEPEPVEAEIVHETLDTKALGDWAKAQGWTGPQYADYKVKAGEKPADWKKTLNSAIAAGCKTYDECVKHLEEN